MTRCQPACERVHTSWRIGRLSAANIPRAERAPAGVERAAAGTALVPPHAGIAHEHITHCRRRCDAHRRRRRRLARRRRRGGRRWNRRRHAAAAKFAGAACGRARGRADRSDRGLCGPPRPEDAHRGGPVSAAAHREPAAGLRAVVPIVGTAVAGAVEVPIATVQFSNTLSPPYPVADLQQALFDGPSPTGTMSEHYREMSGDRST